MKEILKKKLVKIVMKEAQKGIGESGAPFGALIVDKTGKIISKSHNTTKTTNDPTAHAEINALRIAGMKIGTRKLDGLILITNVEPCAMCTLAAIKSGIREFYCGAYDKKVLDTNLNMDKVIEYSGKNVIVEKGILKKETENQVLAGRIKNK